MLHIKSKGMQCTTTFKQIIAFTRTHATPELVQKVKTFFPENGLVAYQIKGNDSYNNKQAIILSFRAPSTHWVGSKCQSICFFSESSHVAYYVKGNEKYNNMQANICPHTLDPWEEFKGLNIFSLLIEVV